MRFETDKNMYVNFFSYYVGALGNKLKVNCKAFK